VVKADLIGVRILLGHSVDETLQPQVVRVFHLVLGHDGWTCWPMLKASYNSNSRP